MPVATASVTACPPGLASESCELDGIGVVSGYRPDRTDQGAFDIRCLVASGFTGQQRPPHRRVCARYRGFSASPGGLRCSPVSRERRCAQQDSTPDPGHTDRACSRSAPTCRSVAFHRATDTLGSRSSGTDCGRGVRHYRCGPATGRVTMSPAARFAHWFVRLYQSAFSGRPSPCRYVPSCSSYALESLESHGFLRGTWLSVRRLARCHPWGGSGWDPVPTCHHNTATSQLVAGESTPVDQPGGHTRRHRAPSAVAHEQGNV